MKTNSFCSICLLLFLLIGCAQPLVAPISSATPVKPVASVETEISPDISNVCSMPYFDPIAWLPDGRRMLVKNNQNFFLLDTETWEQIGVLEVPRATGTVAALSPDGKVMALAYQDNTIQLLQTDNGQLLHTLRGHTDLITKLRFKSQGDQLLSASHDTWIKIWDLQGNLVDSFQPTGADDLPSQILALGISPDGQTLATMPFDGPIKLWDMNTHQEITKLESSGGWDLSDMAFSADGQYLAATLATGLRIWRLADRELLVKDVNSLSFKFSPDGQTLAYVTNAQNGATILVSLADMQTLHTFAGNYGWMIFSPDGALLLSTNSEETWVWQVDEEKLLYRACN